MKYALAMLLVMMSTVARAADSEIIGLPSGPSLLAQKQPSFNGVLSISGVPIVLCSAGGKTWLPRIEGNTAICYEKDAVLWRKRHNVGGH